MVLGLKDLDLNGRHYLSEFTGAHGADIGLDDLTVTTDGKATASLPISFPDLPDIPGVAQPSELNIEVPDLADFSNVSIHGGDVFETARSILSGDFDLSAMIGGWEGAFDLLTDAMNGQLFGLPLPLVGDALKDEARFLSDIKQSVVDNLQSSSDHAAADVQSALYDVLGPGGLNLLVDETSPAGDDIPDGQVTIHDVVSTVDPSGTGHYFRIHLGQAPQVLNVPIDFDLGVPGLALDVDAPVKVALGYDFVFGVGVNLDDGFYIDTSDPSELEVLLDVTVPGLNAEGQLGFLRVHVDDRPTARAVVGKEGLVKSQFVLIGNEVDPQLEGVAISFVNDSSLAPGEESVTYDSSASSLVFSINSQFTTAADLVEVVNTDSVVSTYFTASLPFGGSGAGRIDPNVTATTVADLPSRFTGSFSANLTDPNHDGKLTLGEIFRVESFSDVLDIQAHAVADVDLHVLADFGPLANFPSIRTNISLDWQYSLEDGASDPLVRFTDVEMNLGEFFSSFASGALGEVRDTLEPIEPIINQLRGPVPVLGDLLGQEITYLDLARLYGGKAAGAANFIDSVATIIDIINSIPDLGADQWISFGDADFDLTTGEVQPQLNTLPTKDQVLAATSDLAGFNADLYFRSESEADANNMVLSYPILSDPARIFALLSGDDVDLFTLELPTFQYAVTLSQYFPLPPLPALGVEVTGRLGATIDLAFGYDTFGIHNFLDSGRIEDVFNGFFAFDHENADGTGDDINEVVFDASVTAGVGVNIGIAKAIVGGGIFGNIDFDLHDNNQDGRVRAVELLDNFLLGGIHIFDVSGSIDAELFAKAEFGIGPLKASVDYQITPPIRLLSFNIPRPTGRLCRWPRKRARPWS